MSTCPNTQATHPARTLLRFAGLTLGLIICALITMTVTEAYAKYRAEHRALTIGSPASDAPRPIAAQDSLFIEELTWMEVRDAIRAGKDTAIVAAGGIEQNGPYVVTGKHNVVLRATTRAIAARLGSRDRDQVGITIGPEAVQIARPPGR